MNAHQLASMSSPRTVGELKKYLAELEAAWEPMDTEYLGEFDDQPICHAAYGRGVGRGVAQFQGEFGLVIQENVDLKAHIQSNRM